MRAYLWVILILGLLNSGASLAQTNLAGTWQGTMEITPEQKLTIQFVITKKDDGSYTAVLNSPDTGAIKNIAADSVIYKDGTLNMEVRSLSGTYSGKIADSLITGEWKQPGSTMKLVLAPYEKPKEVPTDPLLGEWVGKLDVQGRNFTVVFRYNKNKDGKFTGLLDIPEQNAKDLPVTEVTLAGDEVNFAVQPIQLKYKGKLEGEKIPGHMIQNTREMEVNFKKGKYEPPPRMLDVSVEAMKNLKGEWVGKLTFVEGIPIPVRIRFEEAKDGKSRAFFDSPNEKMKDIELSDIELKDGKLNLKTGWSRYEGTLKDNAIKGYYILGNMKLEMDLVKGVKLEPLIPQVDISADMMKRLKGRWKGTMNNTTAYIIFKLNENAKNEVLLEYEGRGDAASPFLKVAISGMALSLKATSGEYSGELKGEKIEGVWKQLGNVNPVTLTREK